MLNSTIGKKPINGSPHREFPLPIDSPSFIQLSQKTIYETIFPPIWAFIYPYVCINHRVDMLWSVAKGWGHAHPFGEKWGEMKMLLLWFLLIEHLLHGMECTTRVCWQLRTALLYPFGLLPSSIWVQSPKSGLEWIGSCHSWTTIFSHSPKGVQKTNPPRRLLLHLLAVPVWHNWQICLI